MALFNWLKERSAGILLHPTALPSNQGIGNFGKNAYRFVDFLEKSGLKYWQMCPLGPTGFGDSPYQCFSSFAGNSYLIDFEPLVEIGLLKESDLLPLKQLPTDFVDYGKVWETHRVILKKIFENYKKDPKKLLAIGRFEDFKKKKKDFLHSYALFCALKNYFKGEAWYHWDIKARNYASANRIDWGKSVQDDVACTELAQFLFYTQWEKLRKYANTKGVEIIGDIPIFVALDSADVWQNPDLFFLDKKTYQPTFVAGVPPDYFSEDGQLWGNPLYDWVILEKTNYNWWLKRLHSAFCFYDVVRLDHFRAFYDYWKIPADSKTARTGKWTLGPGLHFFEEVKKVLGNVKLIAEDLGDMNDGVRDLLLKTGLPGMAVLEFAFGGDAKNLYLPHNIKENIIYYPGTHDNNTAKGWYDEAPENMRDHFRRYFWSNGENISWTMINTVFKSTAKIAIVAMQDVLSLGKECRFNEPGTKDKNWKWRMSDVQLNEAFNCHANALFELAQLSNRFDN